MNSTTYTKYAQAADEFGFVIVGFIEMPPSEGAYPGIHAILRDEDRPADRQYAVSMGVHNTDDDNFFFCSSRYDMSEERAIEVFGLKTAAMWLAVS